MTVDSDLAHIPPTQPNAYGPAPREGAQSFDSVVDAFHIIGGMNQATAERAAETASGERQRQFRKPPSDLRGT